MSKELEILVEQRTRGFDDTKRALAIVKKFIIDKQRIVYGGMSIDCPLKAAGHAGIYPEDALPDYDFMSPSYLEDSSELADILFGEGFQGVRAITGMHVTTRRVSINTLNFVADITYVDPITYDRLPTVTYKGMRFIHPHFQMLDMFNSLSFPFDNPPTENIYHRLEKDIKRFNLLDDVYPYSALMPKIANFSYTYTSVTIPREYLHHSVAHGMLAYALLYQAYKYLFTGECSLGAIHDDLLMAKIRKFTLARVDVTTEDIQRMGKIIPAEVMVGPTEVTFDGYGYTTVVSASRKYFESKGNPTYYNSWLGIAPDIMRFTKTVDSPNPLEVYFINNRFLSIHNLKSLGYEDINIVTPPFLASYFMAKWVMAQDEASLAYYISLREMLQHIEDKIASINDEKIALFYVKTSPFFMSCDYYGNVNISSSTLHSLIQKLCNVYGIKTVQYLPSTYTPGVSDNVQHPTFTTVGNPFFAIDGCETKNMVTPLELYEMRKNEIRALSRQG